jgi:anaerobic selenocysteine-containing dehydrogenase
VSRRIASTRRQFLKQGAALTGAGAFGAATSLSASASATLQAAAKATVVLHDPRLSVDAGVIARLEATGARFIALGGDPVRLWRGAERELLSRRDTRLFGVTNWPDFLIVRGLAAETRRRVLHESLDPATGVMTWLIA